MVTAEDVPQYQQVEGAPQSCSVNGIPFEVTEDVLLQYFQSRIGPVAGVKILYSGAGATRQSKGSGFIRFVHLADAERARQQCSFAPSSNFQVRPMTVRLSHAAARSYGHFPPMRAVPPGGSIRDMGPLNTPFFGHFPPALEQTAPNEVGMSREEAATFLSDAPPATVEALKTLCSAFRERVYAKGVGPTALAVELKEAAEMHLAAAAVPLADGRTPGTAEGDAGLASTTPLKEAMVCAGRGFFAVHTTDDVTTRVYGSLGVDVITLSFGLMFAAAELRDKCFAAAVAKRLIVPFPPQGMEGGVAALLGGSSAGHFATVDSECKLSLYGDNRFGQCNVPMDLQTQAVEQVALGGQHTAVVFGEDNELRVFGGQGVMCPAIPAVSVKGVTAVACGALHTVVARGNEVQCFGDNSSGQCVVPDTLHQSLLISGASVGGVAAGRAHSVVYGHGLGAIAFGENGLRQAQVPPSVGKGVLHVSCGSAHTAYIHTVEDPGPFGEDQCRLTIAGPAELCTLPRALRFRDVSVAYCGLAATVAVRSADARLFAFGTDPVVPLLPRGLRFMELPDSEDDAEEATGKGVEDVGDGAMSP